MAEVKHKWLAEIADSFGMNIKDFAAFLGYSRQMLYQVSSGRCGIHKGRLAVALYKLSVRNEEIRQEEMRQADRRFAYRQQLIEQLEERLGGKNERAGFILD